MTTMTTTNDAVTSKVMLNFNRIARLGDISQGLSKAIGSCKALKLLEKTVVLDKLGIKLAGTVSSEAESSLSDLLDIDLLDVLVGSWNKSMELQRYKDPEKYPPDKTWLVSLSDHNIKSSHKPRLEIFLDGKSIGSLEFDLALELKVKGLILRIKGGKIIGVTTGKVQVFGDFGLYGAGIWKGETKEFDLPGNIDLCKVEPIEG